MQGRYNHLLFIILAILITALWFGCSQPDDVIAPISETDLTLSPDRLPTLPDSMVYYFWAIDSSSDPDAYLIGNFIWNNELYRFYDLDSNVIDSVWDVEYDILDPFYKYVAITIEKIGDLPIGSVISVDSIGPIMLKDTLIDPEESPVKMVYPVDLWLGTGFFCVETPTDSNSNDHEASGLWFAEYLYDRIKYADTSNVQFRFIQGSETVPRELIIEYLDSDTSYWDCTFYQFGNCVGSTQVVDTDSIDDGNYDFIYVDVFDADTSVLVYPNGFEAAPETLSVEVLLSTLDTLQITSIQPVVDSHYTLVDTLVKDSFVHTRITFDFVTAPVNITGSPIDTTITLYRLNGDSSGFDSYDSTFRILPFTDYNHELVYTQYIDSQFILVDKFLQSFMDVPDLVGTKWHYKGWALSPYLQPKSSFGSLNKPVWNEFFMQQELAPNDGGLITTGSFKSFRGPDDSNPYSGNKRVPSVPGEDFLYNLPAGVDSVYFANNSLGDSSSTGTVMITVEPDNYTNDWANFPLVYFTGTFPPYYEVSDTTEHEQFQLGDPTFTMTNRFSAVNGSSTGFPAVYVKIARQ